MSHRPTANPGSISSSSISAGSAASGGPDPGSGRAVPAVGVLDGLCSSRRVLLRGLAGVAILPGVLVACSDAGDGGGSGDSGSGGSGSGGGDGGVGSQTLPVTEIPAGGAAVVRVGDRQLVVAQPTEGDFVAFSAVCTHQGTVVTVDAGTELVCPSHGSRFEATDGSVQQGPATQALEPVDVTVDGDVLRFA